MFGRSVYSTTVWAKKKVTGKPWHTWHSWPRVRLVIVSEPDPRKIGKEGLAHRLGWKCTLRNDNQYHLHVLAIAWPLNFCSHFLVIHHLHIPSSKCILFVYMQFWTPYANFRKSSCIIMTDDDDKSLLLHWFSIFYMQFWTPYDIPRKSNLHEVCLAGNGGVIAWHAPCSFCPGVYGVWWSYCDFANFLFWTSVSWLPVKLFHGLLALSSFPRSKKWPTYHIAVPTGNALASQWSIFRENRLTFICRWEG